jgi:hypothetical protein
MCLSPSGHGSDVPVVEEPIAAFSFEANANKRKHPVNSKIPGIVLKCVLAMIIGYFI